MSDDTYDFEIKQGATFNPVLTYQQPQFSVKTITGITKSGQAIVTAASHGVATDGLVWIVGVSGMDQINHRADKLQNPATGYLAYYVDGNTLRLNVDTSRFQAYTSGGELLYHPPYDLTGYTARMSIREDIDSASAVLSLTTENGGIALGGALGTISLLATEAQTAALTILTGVYDLELVYGSTVTRLLSGIIVVSQEVTHD